MVDRERKSPWGPTIAALLTEIAYRDQAGRMVRVAARLAWAGERCEALWRAQREALWRAQREADAAWLRLVAPYDDCDEANLPDFEEPAGQAEVDAIRAEIDAVIAHDRWPAHLYWSL